MARRCSSIKTEEITAHSSGRILPLRLAKGEGEPSSHKGGLSVCLPSNNNASTHGSGPTRLFSSTVSPVWSFPLFKLQGRTQQGWFYLTKHSETSWLYATADNISITAETSVALCAMRPQSHKERNSSVYKPGERKGLQRLKKKKN